jgi:3-oxoacyl-[acyl-carrier protein] reductase
MKLTGRTALVTGASKGLGAAIAELLGREGCKVGVNYAGDAAGAAETVAAVEAAGGEAIALQCDISDETAVTAMVQTMQERFGTVDLLVNNARIDPYKRPATMSDADWWDKTLSVTLKGAYLCAMAVWDGMVAQKLGRIVNVSSVWAYWGATFKMLPYSVAKAGMHALTRGLATEGAPLGINVNTVAPGLIITKAIGTRLTDEQIEDAKREVPLQRGATPEEIAESVLFALGSNFTTGEAININGGVWMGA